MKIALVRPDYSYGRHVITPPLSLGYLASYLKKNGEDAVIIDGLRDNLSPEAVVEKVRSEKADVVGITCLTAYYKEVVELSNLLKKNNIPCIIGGVHPTFLPEQMLIDSNADYVICGQGEIALLKLMKNNFVNNAIPGVYSAKDFSNGSKPGIRAEVIDNLDDIPFPDWEQIDPNLYAKAPRGAIVKNLPIGSVINSRGCPYDCTFCASPNFCGRKIRFRSPENVFEEIRYLIEKFGVKEIHFEDDNLTLKRSHVERLCRLILDNNIKISWACPNGVRADTLDEEIIKLMKASGCYYLSFGIESANPGILNNIKKRESIDTVKKSIELANKHGIQCQGFFIFGLPGETALTIEETISFALSVPLARAQFLILDILPGSELWDNLSGQFAPNWDKNSYREPEWIPEGLTREELMSAQERAFRRFYLRPITFLRLAKFIRPKQIKFLVKRLKDYRLIKGFGKN